MKKFLGLFLLFLSSINISYAKDIRFVQITDVRLSENNKPVFEKTIQDINKYKNIEFVVFTGDSLDKPTKENLEMFIKASNKLKAKYYIVIGDKDVNKHKGMSKKDFIKISNKYIKGNKLEATNYVFEKKGLIFIVADGAKDIVPATNGYFKDSVLEWLDASLDLYQKKKVVIFQHFPLIPPIDKEMYVTMKPDKYLEILKNHNNVMAVISGHFGVNSDTKFGGIEHITTAPMPNYRIIDIIDYETNRPTIWAQAKSAE